MIADWSTRKRAEEFARLVDEPRPDTDQARDADLLELVGSLRSMPAPAPRPEFVAGLRERLMTEADEVLLPRDLAAEERLRLPARTPVSRPNRRLATAAGAIALVGASTSMAVAAQTTVPGDTLYPIKRALESAQTGVRFDDTSRALTVLAIASDRLDEAGELATRGGSDELPAIDAALVEFIDRSEEASGVLLAEPADTDALGRLRGFTADSMHQVELLGSILPPEGAGRLLEVARVLQAIDVEAADLCPSCEGGLTQIPLVLLSAGQLAPVLESIAPNVPADEVPEAAAPPPAIELPNLEAPVDTGASGITGIPEAAADLPSVPAPSTPGAPEPGRPDQQAGKAKKHLDKTIDDLTKGLVGGGVNSDTKGLLPTVTGTVTDTLDTTVGIVGGTLDGLLGGLTD